MEGYNLPSMEAIALRTTVAPESPIVRTYLAETRYDIPRVTTGTTKDALMTEGVVF